jgi:hypothetical protein
MIHQSTSTPSKFHTFHLFSFSFHNFTGNPSLVSSSHAGGPLHRVLLGEINNNNGLN